MSESPSRLYVKVSQPKPPEIPAERLGYFVYKGSKPFKRRVERQKRKENVIKQRSSHWLVVCEGAKTEPNYFKGAVMAINQGIEDKYKLKVTVVGKGMNTLSLVNSVEDFLNNIDAYKISTVPYGKIFVVDRKSVV